MLNSACGQSLATPQAQYVWARMWRSSGRGCTVMPCTGLQAGWAARVTLGMPGGACLRTRATLLTLTDKGGARVGGWS